MYRMTGDALDDCELAAAATTAALALLLAARNSVAPLMQAPSRIRITAACTVPETAGCCSLPALSGCGLGVADPGSDVPFGPRGKTAPV
jgi:hypothetical protein